MDMSGTPKDDRKVHVPGNCIETARRFENYLAGIGRGWAECREELARLEDSDVYVTKLLIKGGWTDGEEVLIVVNADGPDGPLVAFHNASDPLVMWTGLRNRLQKRTLKWRTDEPYR